MFGFIRKSEFLALQKEKAQLSEKLKKSVDSVYITQRQLEDTEMRCQDLEVEIQRRSVFEEAYLKSLHEDITQVENQISKKTQILKLINTLIFVSTFKSKLEQEKELSASKLDLQKKTVERIRRLKRLDEEIGTAVEKIEKLNKDVEQKNIELESLTTSVEMADVVESVTYISTAIPELTSTEIKKKLDVITDRRKAMIEAGAAWNAYAHYYLNDSITAGKAQQKRLAKFLLTAFDAQVDNVIASANKTIFQKSHSKIETWYEKVNKLGRDHSVVIEREYLKLRLDELKVAFEFFVRKKYEKEEERYVNESIREEKRVQKEIEEFVKKREDEANKYQIDIERITKELKESSDAEAEKLKETIQQLHLKLAQVNAEKERAISLAQLTRSGHVYIISNEKSFGKGIYKIGMTRRLDPMDRVKELGNASVPFFFDVHGIIHSDDAPGLERELHRRFDDKRVNKQNFRREFFEVSLEEIQEVISEIHGSVTLEHLSIDIEEGEFPHDED